jgi:putative RecB family exonuclease
VVDVEQLGLEGMPTKLLVCSPSSLASYTDCPRRYRFAYVDRPAPPKGGPWAHNTIGAAAHSALHQWWQVPLPRRTPAAAGTLLRGAWNDDGFRDAEQSARWRERARAWVEDYAATLDPAVEPRGVERQVATKTPTMALSGRIDRLDDRDGRLVVVDYKTGRWVPDEADARSSLALAVYAVAAGRMFHRPCHRVELHHLPSGTVAAAEHTDESLDRHLRRAGDTAADISAARAAVESGGDPDRSFPANPGPHCGLCDFRRVCPVGQAAAPAREPWSTLVEPEAAPPGAPGPDTGVDAVIELDG